MRPTFFSIPVSDSPSTYDVAHLRRAAGTDLVAANCLRDVPSGARRNRALCAAAGHPGGDRLVCNGAAPLARIMAGDSRRLAGVLLGVDGGIGTLSAASRS